MPPQKSCKRLPRTGYLIREGLFQGEALEKLRDALDRLEERESEKRDSAMAGKKGWGFIPRHLMDKDEVFLDLLKFQPTLSIARGNDGATRPPAWLECTHHVSG